MARIEGYHRNNVVPNNEQLDRLIDHARELLRLKAEDGPARMRTLESRPSGGAAVTPTSKRDVRESVVEFLHADLFYCQAAIIAMEHKGFELVSITPNLVAHFRKP